MALTNWNNFFDDFNRYDDLLFPPRYNSLFRPNRRGNTRSNMKLDMKENEHEYVVTVDIPGVDKSKINVNYDNNILTISAERSDERREDKEHYHYLERSYGTYSRSIALSNNVDYEHMSAKYTDGVLNIVVPKSLNISTSRTLKIE